MALPIAFEDAVTIQICDFSIIYNLDPIIVRLFVFIFATKEKLWWNQKIIQIYHILKECSEERWQIGTVSTEYSDGGRNLVIPLCERWMDPLFIQIIDYGQIRVGVVFRCLLVDFSRRWTEFGQTVTVDTVRCYLAFHSVWRKDRDKVCSVGRWRRQMLCLSSALRF